MNIKINELMISSGVQFGTSGVRGLVADMTDQVCFSYVSAFLQYLAENELVKTGDKIGIAGDLRVSTPRIMNAVAAACRTYGFEAVNYGTIPSPAIALTGIQSSMATIMVTGSHIPDDRNGIKFNTPAGEILKVDEEGIRAQNVTVASELFTDLGQLNRVDYLPPLNTDGYAVYIQRYIDFFPAQCLRGINIGLYEHSSVARDCFKEVLVLLGANVTSLARTDRFISVDTEAIRPEDVELAKQWSAKYHFDCIVSTDGDGDRPLISDENGVWLRGDVAGILCAQYFGADTVVTPVSCNSAVEKSQQFADIIRTKIGSPFVIEAMQNAAVSNSELKVVGYEANGGFLQQTNIDRDGKTLHPLPTRDAIIVPLTIMLLAKQHEVSISALVSRLPNRYTYSDRIKNFPTDLSQQIIASFTSGTQEANLNAIDAQLGKHGRPVSIDTTDGLRITFDSHEIIHLRPSGNAPEFRCYTEADSEQRAIELNEYCMEILKQYKS